MGVWVRDENASFNDEYIVLPNLALITKLDDIGKTGKFHPTAEGFKASHMI